MKTFEELGVNSSLVKELDKRGIISPTIVQEKAIPLILKGSDVMVQSETGSGKTLCFAVPTIQMLKPSKTVQVLVITPTRELAKQVGEEYVKFSRFKELKTAVVYGGVSLNQQSQEVKSADVVVGTPGRLLDLLRRKLLNLTYTEYLVIDEADRLMDMGFIDDIKLIINYLPQKRQTVMLSATINSRIMNLMETYLKNPSKIFLENLIKKVVLNQQYINVRNSDKNSLLVHLLKTLKRGLTLVFCNTKNRTRIVASLLKKNKITAEAMNGDMSQYAREKTLREFSKGMIDVLVATDVAARGIHVESITHVVNYDLPEDEETYTHRIGRTARSGSKGTAITLLSDFDFKNMDKIKKVHKEAIEELKVENFERLSFKSFNDRRRPSVATRHLRFRKRY